MERHSLPRIGRTEYNRLPYATRRLGNRPRVYNKRRDDQVVAMVYATHADAYRIADWIDETTPDNPVDTITYYRIGEGPRIPRVEFRHADGMVMSVMPYAFVVWEDGRFDIMSNERFFEKFEEPDRG